MTTKHDELLARLEDARRRIPKIGGAGAIYEAELLEVIEAAIVGHRALTAQVVELTIDRDTAETLRSQTAAIAKEERDRANAAEAQVVERDAVIEQAPHGLGCKHTYYPWIDPCDCIKSQAPRDALAAHDKTVRATALRDAADSYTADGYVTGEHTQGFFGIGDWEGEPDAWLRARADREEDKS